MAEMDREFVEYVVKALVTKPEAVTVKRSVDDMGVLLELSVDQADMGKVIGKAGATAKSLRTLLRVLGAKNDERVNLKIMEPDGGVAPEAEIAAAATEPEAIAAAPIIPEPTPTSDIRAQTEKELAELADLDI